MKSVPQEPGKVIQMTCGHNGLIYVLTDKGEMFEREKDNRDFSPVPKYVWHKIAPPQPE